MITYGIEYSGAKVGEGIQQKAGVEQPLYYWDPVISPCGFTFYDSDVICEWKGNLFLAAISGQHTCRQVIRGHKITGEDRLLEERNERAICHHRWREALQGLEEIMPPPA